MTVLAEAGPVREGDRGLRRGAGRDGEEQLTRPGRPGRHPERKAGEGEAFVPQGHESRRSGAVGGRWFWFAIIFCNH